MSPPRKFSGKVKPGVGIDGTDGENFTKRSQDPWTQQSRGVDYVPGDGIKRSDRLDSRGRGAYVDEDKILRDTGTDPENYAKIDIFDMAEAQSDKTGPVVLRKRDR